MPVRRNSGSPASKVIVGLSLARDRLERAKDRLDVWLLWTGGVVAVIGVATTIFHAVFPNISFTERFIAWFASAVRWVHGLAPWHMSFGDLATYLGFLIALAGIGLFVIKKLNQSGGTKGNR